MSEYVWVAWCYGRDGIKMRLVRTSEKRAQSIANTWLRRDTGNTAQITRSLKKDAPTEKKW